MSTPRDLTQNVVLLADHADARALIIGTLLEEIGAPPFKVIRCSSVAECIDYLDMQIVRPRLLVAHHHLRDGPLLPAVRRWHRAQLRPLPRMILWAPEGLLTVVEHEGFLTAQRAIVFSLPLDLDALLGVARAFALPPYTQRLAHCGWMCRRRRACVRGGRHCRARA
jgi:hypothetical protein